MVSTGRARHSALVVAGVLAAAGISPAASAQRSHPISVQAAQVETPRATTPYPGATVIIEPGWYTRQQHPQHEQGHRRERQHAAPLVVYVPVPSGYGYYPQASYYPQTGYGGGGVYDTNGRPLSSGYESAAALYLPGTPDLSGSPYVVIGGGAMVVDFGTSDRRVVPSCAAEAAARTPDGQARTVFYAPAVDGLILRAGQRGRVIGTPPAGAPACYGADAYGRVVLDY